MRCGSRRIAVRNDVSMWTLRAVSLDGRERVLFSSAGTLLSILDVFHDGRALIAAHVARMGCSCVPPGESQPRDLSWHDGSAPEALSRDGGSVLFSEVLRGANGSIYLRKTDGSDAIRLGDGFGEDLSPDGKWVLATQAGSPPALVHHADRAWIVDQLSRQDRWWPVGRPTFCPTDVRSCSEDGRRIAAGASMSRTSTED